MIPIIIGIGLKKCPACRRGRFATDSQIIFLHDYRLYTEIRVFVANSL